MFSTIDANNRTFVENPKLEAYKYMAYLANVLRLTYSLKVEDGRYTVESAGLMPLTFCAAS